MGSNMNCFQGSITLCRRGAITLGFSNLADNHSKILLVRSEAGDTVSVITSQNLTRGDRHESAFISTSPEIFANLYDQVNDLITNHSVPLHDLFSERIAAD